MTLRILHISFSDSFGGASRAAYRIHSAISRRSKNTKSIMSVAHKASGDTSVLKYEPSAHIKLFNKIRLKYLSLRRSQFTYEFDRYHSTASYGTGMYDTCMELIQHLHIDIVHLHWLGDSTLSIEEVGRLPVPIVVTLHDCWFFLGSEHYPSFIDQHAFDFVDGYSNHSPHKCLNRHTWLRKDIAWRHTNINFVATSHWLRKLASKSQLTRKTNIVQIPYPLDTLFWRPIERHYACKELGLNSTTKYILYGADGGTVDYRKGSDLLYSALQQYPETEFLIKHGYELLIFGQDESSFNPLPSCIPIRCVGRINDDSILRALYSVADVMIVPSRQEAFGQTASEALSCGTPVLSFCSTGLSSVVTHKRTGYLVKQLSPHALLDGLSWLLEDACRLQKISIDSRLYALNTWDPLVIATKYTDLYRAILSYGQS